MFTQEELKDIDTFEKQHANCHKGTGKSTSFIITKNYNSGIGPNIYIKCNCCEKEVDITDYGSW